MPTFVAEYRSRSIAWEAMDHPSVSLSEVKQMRTTYVTVPVDIVAPDLETAKAVAENRFPNMVRKVYAKNLDKTTH